jgi:Zn-finger protein
MKKKLINKKIKKLVDKKCKFCECNVYDLLDVHRIIEGKNGGKYTDTNTITVCSLCHRKIHSGIIKVDRKYPSTSGWVLHYFDENGLERFD